LSKFEFEKINKVMKVEKINQSEAIRFLLNGKFIKVEKREIRIKLINFILNMFFSKVYVVVATLGYVFLVMLLFLNIASSKTIGSFFSTFIFF